MMGYGLVIRNFRIARGLSIAKLAAHASISMDYLFRIETGRAKNMGIQTLEKIAKALNVPIYEILMPNRPHLILEKKNVQASA